MKAVTAREANQSFSRWLGLAERGEEILITKRGKPVAKLVPVTPTMSEAERRKLLDETLALMRRGFPIGGRRFTRDEIYEDRIPKYLRDLPDAPPDQGEAT